MSLRRIKGRFRAVSLGPSSAPSNSVAPAITGNAWVGSTLTCSTGTWTNTPIFTYSYQWKRGVTNVGTDQNTYVPVTGDIGSTITCTVTATNAIGSTSQVSNTTAAVLALPVNTVAPAVTGTAQVGETLTTTTGTWTGGGITYSYQWVRNPSTNVGTNQNTYVPVVGDIGSTIRCVVTASNAVGGDQANSNNTAAVIAAVWTPATLGSALVGWWKADVLSGANNDPISPFTDSSGNGRDGTAAGSERAILKTAALNGLNVLEFDGSDDQYALPNFMTAFTAGTMFAVVKLDADPPLLLPQCGPPMSSGTSGNAFVYPFTDTQVYSDWGSTVRSIDAPGPSMANWHIVMFLSAPSNWRHYMNGVSVLTLGTNTVGFKATPLIGSDSLGGGVFLDGRIAEIFMTNTSMSGADQTESFNYLNTKWALGL